MEPDLGIDDGNINLEMAKYSKKLWEFKPIGIGMAILYNISFMIWRKKSICSLMIREFLMYQISLYLIQKFEDNKEKQ